MARTLEMLPLDAFEQICGFLTLAELVSLSETCRQLNIIARGVQSPHAATWAKLGSGELCLQDVSSCEIPRVCYKEEALAWPYITFKYNSKQGRGELKIQPPTWVTRVPIARSESLVGHRPICICHQCAASRAPNRVVVAWDGVRPPPECVHTVIVANDRIPHAIPARTHTLVVYGANDVAAPLKSVTDLRVLRLAACNIESWPTPLRLLRGLYAKHCNALTSIAAFANVRRAEIKWCASISDVDPLSRCEYVDLTGCVNVERIGALWKVRSLDVTDCSGITDFGCLNQVKYFTASRTRITSTASLKSAVKVVLNGCHALVDLVGLPHAVEISVRGCLGVTTVEHLKSAWLESVDVSRTLVSDISRLRNVRVIRIEQTALLVDLRDMLAGGTVCRLDASNSACGWAPQLDNLVDVHLDYCILGEGAYFAHAETISLRGATWPDMATTIFPRVRTLDISHTSVRSVRGLRHVQDLTITGCRLLGTTAPLAGTPGAVVARACTRLWDLSGLSNKSVVILDRCPRVADVSPLSSVGYLSLVGCKAVCDVSGLGRVRYLDIRKCDNVDPAGARRLAGVTTLLASEAIQEKAKCSLFRVVMLMVDHVSGQVTFRIHNVGKRMGQFSGYVSTGGGRTHVTATLLINEVREMRVTCDTAHVQHDSIVSVCEIDGSALQTIGGDCRKRKRPDCGVLRDGS